jgi:hypothetical protein
MKKADQAAEHERHRREGEGLQQDDPELRREDLLCIIAETDEAPAEVRADHVPRRKAQVNGQQEGHLRDHRDHYQRGIQQRAPLPPG